MKITGRYNSTVLNGEQMAFLISEAGVSYGLGEWRNERKGVFGAFHIADAAEQKAWDAFATGNGPLPTQIDYLQAAE